MSPKMGENIAKALSTIGILSILAMAFGVCPSNLSLFAGIACLIIAGAIRSMTKGGSTPPAPKTEAPAEEKKEEPAEEPKEEEKVEPAEEPNGEKDGSDKKEKDQKED